MSRINPELLDKTPTGYFKGNLVKVYDSTKGLTLNREPIASAEILSGPNKGKLTTVYLNQLTNVNPKTGLPLAGLSDIGITIKPKTCNCCNRVYKSIPVNAPRQSGLIWFDCLCGSTLVSEDIV